MNQHRNAEQCIFARTANFFNHMVKIKNKKAKSWSIFKSQKDKAKVGDKTLYFPKYAFIYQGRIQPACRNDSG